MNFIITKNKELDLEMIKTFFDGGSPSIKQFWPEINKAEDIPKYVEVDYNDKMELRIKELKLEIPRLDNISTAISTIIGESWDPIENIDIYVGACPIAPRFLDTYSFLLPYYYPISRQIKSATEELIHFLYFKKWVKLFPSHSRESYEFPNPVNILSEISAAVIANDSRISSLVGSKGEVYPNWREIRIDGHKITTSFEKIYRERKSFDDFLKVSWLKYQELEEEYGITNQLTRNPY